MNKTHKVEEKQWYIKMKPTKGCAWNWSYLHLLPLVLYVTFLWRPLYCLTLYLATRWQQLTQSSGKTRQCFLLLNNLICLATASLERSNFGSCCCNHYCPTAVFNHSSSDKKDKAQNGNTNVLQLWGTGERAKQNRGHSIKAGSSMSGTQLRCSQTLHKHLSMEGGEDPNPTPAAGNIPRSVYHLPDCTKETQIRHINIDCWTLCLSFICLRKKHLCSMPELQAVFMTLFYSYNARIIYKAGLYIKNVNIRNPLVS